MANVFFTSDDHLGHRGIIEFCQRPFSGIDEQTEVLIERWNSVVRHKDDVVYVLGDWSIEGSMNYALSQLPRFNGHKRLIMGNHDNCWVGKSDGMRFIHRYIDAGFEVVVPWARIKLSGQSINLSHFPYVGDHTREERFDEYRLRPSVTPLLHGHTHSESHVPYKASIPEWSLDTEDEPRFITGPQIHVGVDAWNFTPVPFDTILELINAAGT